MPLYQAVVIHSAPDVRLRISQTEEASFFDTSSERWQFSHYEYPATSVSGYTSAYKTSDGEVLCAKCATKRLHETLHEDGNEPVTGVFVAEHTENLVVCSDCWSILNDPEAEDV